MPKLLAELAALAMALVCVGLLVHAYTRRQRAEPSGRLDRPPHAMLWLVVLMTVAGKLGEDVITGESGPTDRRLLLGLHAWDSPAWHDAFVAITSTGSAAVLLPLTIAAASVLWLARRGRDAVLLAGSVTIGAMLVFAIKSLVDRRRPALWAVGDYWGSSFPSGHTLVVTAFAMAAALVLARGWPAARVAAFAAALLWIVLVGLSRLVLGVHWPSDVLAAGCLGAALALGLAVALDSAPVRGPPPRPDPVAVGSGPAQHPRMVQGEQRRHPRHRVHLHVVVSPPRAAQPTAAAEAIPELPVTAVVDLSESGAGLDWSLPADIRVGAEVRLRFLLAGGQTIDVEGIVVRVGGGRAGIEFLPAARAVVRQLLAESRSD